MLVLNIGNTHTQVALVRDGRLGPVRCLPTDLLTTGGASCSCLAEHAGLPCLAACVVPAAARELERSRFSPKLRFLRADMVTELDFSGVDVSTLGADRVANAVAGLELTDPPFLVLDCGTAITSEVVDGSFRFRGGIIAPGRRLQRRALRDYTGQLPDVPLQHELPGPLGTKTVGAIVAGIDLGLLGLVERIVADTRRELGAPALTVLVAGGDAPYFLRHLSGLKATPQDFTLRGLARIGRSHESDVSDSR